MISGQRIYHRIYQLGLLRVGVVVNTLHRRIAVGTVFAGRTCIALFAPGALITSGALNALLALGTLGTGISLFPLRARRPLDTLFALRALGAGVAFFTLLPPEQSPVRIIPDTLGHRLSLPDALQRQIPDLHRRFHFPDHRPDLRRAGWFLR